MSLEQISQQLPVINSSEELLERVEIIIHKLKFVTHKPTVVFLNNIVPVSSDNSSILLLLAETAGGTVLSLPSNPDSDMASLELLLQLDPEVLVFTLSHSDVENTVRQIDVLFNWDGWNGLTAVKKNNVYIIDTANSFELSGQKAVDSLEMLGEILQPKYFVFGNEGESWVKFGA